MFFSHGKQTRRKAAVSFPMIMSLGGKGKRVASLFGDGGFFQLGSIELVLALALAFCREKKGARRRRGGKREPDGWVLRYHRNVLEEI